MALNLQAVFDAEVELPQGPECCICYETIGKTNNCTTPCGHDFCFKCMVKCLSQNSACPYCRTALIEEEEQDNDDDDGSDVDSDSDDSDTSSNYACGFIIGKDMVMNELKVSFCNNILSIKDISRLASPIWQM